MSEIEKYITDEMRERFEAARCQALQSDLRVVADRIRNEAPDGSAGFQAGTSWAPPLVDNIASTLTKP